MEELSLWMNHINSNGSISRKSNQLAPKQGIRAMWSEYSVSKHLRLFEIKCEQCEVNFCTSCCVLQHSSSISPIHFTYCCLQWAQIIKFNITIERNYQHQKNQVKYVHYHSLYHAFVSLADNQNILLQSN